MSGKHIYAKSDRRWPPSKIPQGDDPAYAEERFAKDHTRGCSNCGMKPVVNAVGMCGPCTWGECETIDGNW